MAFDTLEHAWLQKRLIESFGISQKALSLVNLYLSDRKQAVTVFFFFFFFKYSIFK